MGTFAVTKAYTAQILLTTYTGPGDLISGATGWWGLRAYSKSRIGTNAIRLRRDSDNTEQDFTTVGGGGLDLTGITSFKGAANLFVTKLYDQSGSGFDASNATQSQQPAFTLNGLGLLPVMQATGGSIFLSTAAVTATVQPGTISAVINNTGTGAQANYVIFGVQQQLGVRNSANNQVFAYAGSVVAATASDGSWHALQAVFNGSSSDMNVDGTSNTGSVGGGAGTLMVATLFSAQSQNPVGYMNEAGYWPLGFTGSQSSSMSANQHAYWGF